MLHLKDWKGCAQSYHTLTFIFAFLFLLTTACGGQQNNANNAQKDQPGLTADQLAAADSIIKYLHMHVAAIGFSDAAFSLNTLEQKLEALQKEQLPADSIQLTGRQLMEMLEASYLSYAKGMRYGFMNPKETFGANNYDVKIEQADSTFIAEATEAFSSAQPCTFLDACQPTSKAYHALLKAYQNDTSAVKKKRIAYNLERLRWRDTNTPADNQRYIFVNVPAQQVWAIAPDSVFSMRICCGAPKTKTPLLTSAIHLIQLNPEWNIPFSIIRNEVSRHAGDSAYFDRNQYYITDRNGNQIAPKVITAQQLASGAYRVAQRSGALNSLGRIIFRFPNRFSVYLHDTNNKSAFKAERRTVSHGCIRLQRPFDMAEFVLDKAEPWLLDRMRISMDLTPKTEKGREYVKTHGKGARLINSTDVTPTVPVCISYFTVYPNPETGIVETYPDRYSYDKLMEKALKPFLP